MSSNTNNILKNNNMLGIKPKRKSIPININTNPAPDKFLFSNHSNNVNNIASSYLSMGRRIQFNKNVKTSKIIHVNTNSASNYYTLNSKETKQTNGSITNSILNSLKNNNRSEINSININNYININNNNYSLPQNSEIKRINIINPKDKKKLSNSKLPNGILINGYQNSKNNNINNSIFKNKINNKTYINNLSKNKEVHSTRQNYLDSRDKTKKIPMKSKIRQFKYQYKNNKPVSTSFNNAFTSKRHFQGSYQRDLYNYAKDDLLNNLNNGKNYENNLLNKNTNYNLINSNNLYEIKNKHIRNNTTSFGNKDIMNIFHKKSSSTKINNNINVINDNNINNNESNPSNHKNIIHKINNSSNSRKQTKKLSANGKISDIRILINEKRLNSKDNKYNTNNINNNQNHNIYYSKYLSNHYLTNYHSNNNYNIPSHLIKNTNSNNANINIKGIKKIIVKPTDNKKVNLNQNKISGKPIPTPCQKTKYNMIPSQRNLKINLTKFLQGAKTKQNNKTKIILDKKSYSIKRISKENNSDFSLSELNDKLSNKLLKNNEEEKNNIDIMNNKANNQIKDNIENKNNLIIDNKLYNIPDELIKDLSNHNYKNVNNKNYIDLNCNSNNSTNNNIYFGNNKNDYSVDNVLDPINPFNPNIKLNPERKKSIENGLQNITDININSNSNNENCTTDNRLDLIKAEQIINKEKKEENKNKGNYSTNNSEKTKNNNSIINNNEIKNKLFDEENLEDLPEDYDENFNDLYSIINKMNFGNVLVCVEGLFTPEGRTYKKYKDKFDKFYDKLYSKKGNSFANSNCKQNKFEVGGLTSNAKTNSSSSKKNVACSNLMYNDLNIVRELNVNC